MKSSIAVFVAGAMSNNHQRFIAMSRLLIYPFPPEGFLIQFDPSHDILTKQHVVMTGGHGNLGQCVSAPPNAGIAIH